MALSVTAKHKAAIVALLRKECAPPDPGEVEVEERKGMAVGGVPELYLDALARLQSQKPRGEDWRLAVEDGGKFLDRWGKLAVEFGWTAAHLFGMPLSDGTGGLCWFLKGRAVRSLGPEHAGVGPHQIYDRETRREFLNAFGPG